MKLLLVFLFAGCVSTPPPMNLDTSTCDPLVTKCYAITEHLLDKFIVMDDTNDDLKRSLKHCQRHDL